MVCFPFICDLSSKLGAEEELLGFQQVLLGMQYLSIFQTKVFTSHCLIALKANVKQVLLFTCYLQVRLSAVLKQPEAPH